jgi:predicted SAM-dependent methyltransferase
MIQTIEYKNKTYLKIQEEGYASQYAIPYAKKICKGIGYDIGCMKKEWSFPNSIPIDISFNDGWTAINLPKEKYGKVDYIFSSHCLEHIDNWVFVLDYWYENIKNGGILFLYLPHYKQEYWRPYNNKKHKHIFTTEILNDYMTDRGYKNIFYSGVDLMNSFMIVGEKSIIK